MGQAEEKTHDIVVIDAMPEKDEGIGDQNSEDLSR